MLNSNNNLKKQLLMCMSLILSSLVMQASGAPLVTLKEMVQKVVTENPEVQARYHAYEGAGFEQEIVRGGYLPKADITSTLRKQEDLTGTQAQKNSGIAIPTFNNELVLRQMIFDGFATRNEVNRLGHAKRVRYYELQSAMQNTSLEFVKAYIDTLRYRELTEYAKNNYVVHKQLFDRIQERVNAGVARRVDLDQATGRMALAEANLLTETTNLHDVTARMQRILGELPPETLEAPTFSSTGVQPTPAEALQLAYLQNPDLLSTIEDIQAAKDEAKGKKSKYSPRFDLQARKNLGVSNDGRFSTTAADVVELTMNLNLFNGFSDQNSINQAAEKLNTAKDQRDKSCVDTRQIVSIAYNDIASLKEQLVYRDQHQKSIENAREAYRKQFDIGQRSLLDLLDTENEYFQAKRSYVNTQYDVQNAYARVYAGQGELLNKIGSTRADLPEVAREEYLNKENVCQAIAPVQMEIDKATLLANAKPLGSTINLASTVGNTKAIPLVAGQVSAASAGVCSTEVITTRVNDWAGAWRQKNYADYMKFYSEKFTPEPPLSKSAWEKQRKDRLSVYGKINLDLANIKITCDGEKAKAVFAQDYSVTTFTMKKEKTPATGCEVCNAKRIPVKGFADKVSKELDFERQNNQWQIVKELVIK